MITSGVTSGNEGQAGIGLDLFSEVFAKAPVRIIIPYCTHRFVTAEGSSLEYTNISLSVPNILGNLFRITIVVTTQYRLSGSWLAHTSGSFMPYAAHSSRAGP